MFHISENTKAILLLTAPLLIGRKQQGKELLKPREYREFAKILRAAGHEPADLLGDSAVEVLKQCAAGLEQRRLDSLLGRGFLLSQAIERWSSRSIWVISRADDAYPRRLKARLREDAPAVLYGCGDPKLLGRGGLAVVGSRKVDDELVQCAVNAGERAARAGMPLVSGGAKGIDQAAMRGALESGGVACGVLADRLERSVIDPSNRKYIEQNQLALISTFDPAAGFNVGNAMQRNKYIYALSDAALVVNADLEKGGTWAGAKEQLKKFKFVIVFVRRSDPDHSALSALSSMGAVQWQPPEDPNEFVQYLSAPDSVTRNRLVGEISVSIDYHLKKPDPPLVDNSKQEVGADDAHGDIDGAKSVGCSGVPITSGDDQITGGDSLVVESLEPSAEKHFADNKGDQNDLSGAVSFRSKPDSPPADQIYGLVKRLLLESLKEPMGQDEIAELLGISRAQTTAWLKRLLEDGTLGKQARPAKYFVRSSQLFE